MSWLTELIYEGLYNVTSFICWMMQCIYETFEIFAGIRPVKFNGQDAVLFDVFFNNDSIAYIYWGMATIGLVLCFAFAIVAVIRKMFDINDKMQATVGAILGNMLKSVILIVSLNFIMTIVIHSTTVLLQQVDDIFRGGKYAGTTYGKTIEFQEDDYATMARIYYTIGNYSLNSTYESRVNINSCFNEIREDLRLLEKKDVFDFDYRTTEGEPLGESWQSVLTDIAKTRDLSEEMPIDEYDEGLIRTITHAMDILKQGAPFYALSTYTTPEMNMVEEETRLDTIMLLTGTMRAAANAKYNKDPSLMDPLRGPYMTGNKDIYELSLVSKDFKLDEIDYIMIIIGACFFGYQLIMICMNTIGRIFNMIMLYLIAPPVIAASPLDGDGKLKQWTTAFLVQSLSIFATLMAMRLITLFIPIIYSGNLELFDDSGARNYFIRLFFVVTLGFTANKSVSMISGILADSAGWQAINAGNVGDGVRNDVETFGRTVGGLKDKIFGKGQQSGGGQSGGQGADSGGAMPQNKSSVGDRDTGGSNQAMADAQRLGGEAANTVDAGIQTGQAIGGLANGDATQLRNLGALPEQVGQNAQNEMNAAAEHMDQNNQQGGGNGVNNNVINGGGIEGQNNNGNMGNQNDVNEVPVNNEPVNIQGAGAMAPPIINNNNLGQ
ncbi:MAG: hypothetical protein IIX07_07655 [Lachnospiraceae bacterium]|nr:hypothetical protein [Lachnospiraceae bacterium]